MLIRKKTGNGILVTDYRENSMNLAFSGRFAEILQNQAQENQVPWQVLRLP
jgi:hypothetical protein